MQNINLVKESNMDQTAVEWFVGQMFLQGYLNDSPMTIVNINHFVRQAKEMEAKQRQEDTNHGYAQGYDDAAQGKEPMQPETL
jgi:hypothetical protein